MDGIIVIDKPEGMTSHDVVSHVRRVIRMRRVGHAGTLDPMATGVLVILLGRATKLFNQFVTFDKSYRATLILGTKTTTADTQGKVIQQLPYQYVTESQVKNVFQQFLGETQQVPPMVSAIKVGGQRLYKLARQGIEVERAPRKIRISELNCIDFALPKVTFSLNCSKGTYVRKLAEDVGDVLGCGACICKIQRTKVGPFAVEQAVKLENVNKDHIRSWAI